MFEHEMNPSSEGTWNRVAPYLALLAIVAAFCLALTVLVAAIQTSQHLNSQALKDAPTAAHALIVGR